MKKLNKKGFTLVELLAVIVILAVIMVITIPTVLSSMSSATDSAAQSAIASVQKYIDDQENLCKAGLGSMAPYESDIFAANCVIDGNDEDAIEKVLEKAGYSKEFSDITFKEETVESCVAVAEGTTVAAEKQCTTSDNKAGEKVSSEKQTNKIASVTPTGNGQFGSTEITYKANQD